MAARSSIDLDRDPQAIIAVRELDAPRALVCEAWSDPKHLSQWWGPTGFTTTTGAFDMRPGGVWRFVMHGPDGRDYENRITFDEIVKPSLLRYHHGGGAWLPTGSASAGWCWSSKSRRPRQPDRPKTNGVL